MSDDRKLYAGMMLAVLIMMLLGYWVLSMPEPHI
jgi:hypothetical protein